MAGLGHGGSSGVPHCIDLLERHVRKLFAQSAVFASHCLIELHMKLLVDRALGVLVAQAHDLLADSVDHGQRYHQTDSGSAGSRELLSWRHSCSLMPAVAKFLELLKALQLFEIVEERAAELGSLKEVYDAVVGCRAWA